MALSGLQVTRLWPYGGPGENYGSFAGKTAVVIIAPQADETWVIKPRLRTLRINKRIRSIRVN